MKRLSLANLPAACTSTDYNITTPNDSPNNLSLSLPPSPIKTQKRTPTPSVASGTTLHTSRTADSVNSFGYNEAAMNSLLESISRLPLSFFSFMIYSSWIFSFSLLAKIVLVSAERTPVTLLLKQKNSSPNKSLLVKKKATRVADCKTADALFISDRPSTPERDLTRQNSRRGSLSSILGPPSPSASHRDSVSSGNPFEDTLSLSRHSSFAEEELYPLDVESINRLRSELNAPRTPPAQFGELARGDSRSYGDLENLLLSRLESYAEFNYVEEFNGSYDTQESSTEYTFEQDDPFNMSSEHSEPLHGGQDHHHGMELLIQEKKFRLNPEGELLVEENGEFVRASKNLSLYYDMITDKELNILQETFQSSPFLSRSAPSSSSILQLSNSYHQHPPTHGMAMDPFHQSKLTAVDILSPNRIHYTSHASNERVIFEDNEKKVKEELLEKHHEFVDTLCRITELKSHNNSILSKERNIPRKYRKKTGEETPNHSHVTNPYHEAFGRVFDEYLD